jgi:hypothetical protein
MEGMDGDTATRRDRVAIFIGVAAMHAILLWVFSWSEPIPVLARRDANESLVFLILPNRTPPSYEQDLPHQGPSQPPTANPLLTPRPRQPPSVEEPPGEKAPLTIDWTAETELAAEHQAQLAANSPHRALDSRASGADLNGGLGPGSRKEPEFGWSHSRIHRVESLAEGGSIIWINDRCFIAAVGLIPLPFCRIGKIAARGDLFEHVRDPRDLGSNSAPGAP